MNVLLALWLWLALILSSCCGENEPAGGHEEEELTTDNYDYPVTGTPDYDYNATFDYYYVTGTYYGVKNKASVIGAQTLVLLLGLAVLKIWH